MEFFIGLVVGAVGGVIVMFFVYKNNKAKFKSAVDKALYAADVAEKKLKPLEDTVNRLKERLKK